METVGKSAQAEENYGFQTVEHDVTHDHSTSPDILSAQITPMYLGERAKSEG